MAFKDFITRQRILIFLLGMFVFVVSLVMSHVIGLNSIWGELFVDLSASAVTIVFTAFIIDYLSLKERADKTINAVSLAEREIHAQCMRINWSIARLFGFERQRLNKYDVSNHQEARELLSELTIEIDTYLAGILSGEKLGKVKKEALVRYTEHLDAFSADLEQILILYEYALSYVLKEAILNLRSELQSTDRLLNFIDPAETLNESSLSLVNVTTRSIYDAVQGVLALDLEPKH